jgi:hypothetical protein
MVVPSVHYSMTRVCVFVCPILFLNRMKDYLNVPPSFEPFPGEIGLSNFQLAFHFTIFIFGNFSHTFNIFSSFEKN